MLIIEDKFNNVYILRKVIASNVINYLDTIASFRIKYFKEFPYLYEGNKKYEENYIKGFTEDPHSLLLLLYKNDELIGVSTALPLLSCADILEDTENLFEKNNLTPSEFYYFGEIIVKPEFQKRGLAKRIYQFQENYAKNLGFKQLTIATVVRDANHPLRPSNYSNSDIVWEKLGYTMQKKLKIEYSWPTIQPNGEVRDQDNTMVYWTKKI